MIPSLLGISVILFCVLALAPGDPFAELAANPAIPPEVAASLRAKFGLDDPVWMRYLGEMDAVVAGVESRRVCDMYGSRYLGWVENGQGNVGLALVERAAAAVAADGRRGLIFVRRGVRPQAVDRADQLGIAIFGFDPRGGTLDGVNLVGRKLRATGLER